MTSFLKSMSGYNGVRLGEYPAPVHLVRQAFYNLDCLFELILVNIRQSVFLCQQSKELVFAASALYLGFVHGTNKGNALLVCQLKHLNLVEPVGIKEIEPLNLLSQLVFPGIQVRELILDVCQQTGRFGDDRSICSRFQIGRREGNPCPLAIIGRTELFQILAIDALLNSTRLLLLACLSFPGRLCRGRLIDRQCFDFGLLFERFLIQDGNSGLAVILSLGESGFPCVLKNSYMSYLFLYFSFWDPAAILAKYGSRFVAP